MEACQRGLYVPTKLLLMTMTTTCRCSFHIWRSPNNHVHLIPRWVLRSEARVLRGHRGDTATLEAILNSAEI